MRVKLNETLASAPEIIYRAEMLGAKDIFFEPGENDDYPVSFGAAKETVYGALDYESEFGVWLKDFPYCMVNEASRDHIIPGNTDAGEKTDCCRGCKYQKICAGFPKGYFGKFGENELETIKDLPAEVMIEVEPKCNYNCAFCYNHNSFAKKDRKIKSPTADYVKKIIDNAAFAEIKIIRFTGGEPLLRKDIFTLMTYAKASGLEVRLNTNCSLVKAKIIGKFKDVLDNVLIPIESYTDEREAEITGYKDALRKKTEAVKLFKNIGVSVVRVGTVATPDNISELEKLADFILALPVDEWELYRPISHGQNKQKLTGAEIKKLINGIIKIRGKTDKKVILANALPFCALSDPNKINNVSHGALFDDGHSRIVVDPRGFAKPHYFLDKNIGDPLDILSAWNHPFMKKMRNLEFLPNACHECNFRFKCRGGSRFEAFNVGKQWDAPDPLANFNNLT